ncbi:hypothetical protein L21SP3_00289 [Sedimentisphaera cyanobacteriorum]|uniref:Uncharacterized protein n=1 Tax=Sedimentisphaera cyanobacteriorum TaxID=1940790 RepID=A0A1Q2HMR1_9BACT|nr:hypothetical protein [Sedimentisphaera cyanobacteriorum]AQQ08506.1 hypothetical protein L21SP3_00289 [Sedimentisphaera cyanobacteriorum]
MAANTVVKRNNFISFEFTPGEHTFTWSYCKDSYWQAGNDMGMIDNIQFTEE